MQAAQDQRETSDGIQETVKQTAELVGLLKELEEMQSFHLTQLQVLLWLERRLVTRPPA